MENLEHEIIDLATLDTSANAENGMELELVHFDTGRPLNVFITLIGTDSRKYRKELSRVTQEQQSEDALESNRKGSIELVAQCTVGWRNIRLDGENLPCTYENAKRLYDRFNWIREQAFQFINTRSNFLPA